MKHILLNFNHYRTPKDLGGLRSWHIGSHLAKNGYRVTAIIPAVDTLTGRKKKGLKGKLWSKEVINGVDVFWVNSFKNDRTSKFQRAWYYLSSSLIQTIALSGVKDIDLIVCMSMPLTSIFFSFVQCVIRKIPFAIDVRDLPTDTAVELNYFKKNLLIDIVLRIEKFIFSRSDCLIPVSEGWGNRLKEKGISSKKITVIPLGFEGTEIYEEHADWNRDIRAELDFYGKFVIVYTGTLGHVFDISTVLKAAEKTKHINEIVYLFAGGGQCLNKYKKYARDNNLNCLFLGPRPKLDVPLFCSQMDLCICPYNEGKYLGSILGNKIFDYMGNGAATIFSGPEGDVSQLIEKSNGGVCVPTGDSDAMVKEILYLYNNPEKLNTLGESAKAYIKQNFMVSKMMHDFEKCIANVITNNRIEHGK